MPKITDTYALAYACCETILKELNRFPTIDLIRERIGVNSPNTIKKAMNDWTETFAKHYIEQQQNKMGCPEVPSILTDAVYQLWRRTVTEAEQRSNEHANRLQQQITQLQQIIEEHKSALSETIQALEQKTSKLEAAETQITTLTHDYDLLQNNFLAAQQREQALTQSLDEQIQRELTLKDQHAERLKQEQDWMQRRILEERDLATEKWQTKQQHLEERMLFLKKQTEQVLQLQTVTQAQNQQLMTEIAHLKARQTEKAQALLPTHRFKRKRDRS